MPQQYFCISTNIHNNILPCPNNILVSPSIFTTIFWHPPPIFWHATTRPWHPPPIFWHPTNILTSHNNIWHAPTIFWHPHQYLQQYFGTPTNILACPNIIFSILHQFFWMADTGQKQVQYQPDSLTWQILVHWLTLYLRCTCMPQLRCNIQKAAIPLQADH